jgi:hypothetical protein
LLVSARFCSDQLLDAVYAFFHVLVSHRLEFGGGKPRDQKLEELMLQNAEVDEEKSDC